MKILLLIDALDIGGAETHVITLAKGLNESGHEVSVLSSGGDLEEKLAECGVRVLRFCASVTGAAFGLALIRHVAFLRRLQKQHGFDILHAHTRRTAVMLRALRLCERLFGLRLPPRLRAPCLPYRRRARRRLALPALIVTAHAKFAPRYRRLSFWGDATVAVSADLKQHVSGAFGVPNERIRVVVNGIDQTVFYPIPPCAESGEGVLSVLFASRLDKDCALAAKALIEIAPRLAHEARKRDKGLRITILGGGEEYNDIAMRAERINRQRESGEQLIHVRGATADPADFFRDADVFVGVSRAALEALFCGCAVVLAGDEGFGGLLTPHNFDALAEQNFCCRGQGQLSGERLEQALFRQILRVVDMGAEQKRQLLQEICARAQGRYSAASMCEQTARLYEKTLVNKRKLQLLIGGYAGCENLGDDAILRALVRRWQRQVAPQSLVCPHAAPIAAGATLALTALTGGRARFGIPCVSRTHLLDLLRAMRGADTFVLGGGALLQNCSSHGARSLAYYLALLCLSRLCGCPFTLVANGIGPLKGWLPRALTIRILRKARGISARDGASRSALIGMGMPPDRIEVEPDPVLSICADEDAAKRLLSVRGIPARYVCIVARPTDACTLSELTEAVRRLWKDRGAYPLFFAFDQRKDAPVCREMMRACGAGRLLPCEREQTVAGVFALSVGVVSLRLHGLILAKAADAPALCVPYSPCDAKTVNFARTNGQAVADEHDLWEKMTEMMQ
ncbi:MAG: glycosyltransferase [Clostridia bacterium]|nr:glycosyltransferase [Clostridia bacterium]